MNRALAWTAWIYVTAGLVAAPLYLLAGPSVRSAVIIFTMLLLLPACVIARRAHGFPLPFIGAAATIGALYVTSAIVDGALESPLASTISSVIDIVANALILAIFAFAVSRRRGRFTSGDVLDGLIIGLGGWLIAWITLVQPFISLPGRSPRDLLLNAAYLPMAAPLLALAGALVLSGLARRPATWLIVSAIGTNVAGDALFALHEVGRASVWAETTSGALYTLAFAFTGAAFIHPTSPELLGRVEHHRRLRLQRRLTLTGFVLTLPILMMELVPATSASDRYVRAGSALAVLALISIRLASATRAHLHSQEALLRAARTDALTGLPNRIAMLESARSAFDESPSDDRRPAVFLIDIDRFKNTNDALGHAAGDEALRVIAQRLAAVADEAGLVLGRPAGDEFLVLDGSSRSAGEALAHAELFHDVFRTPLPIEAGVVFLTASIGVATTPLGERGSPADLFRQADIAMYRAKDAGRNCLAVYDDSMQQRVAQRIDIENALHSAIDNREMALHHQPIVDAETGRVCGFEALIRWQRSDGSMMSPAEFIPIAEETGLITSIGAWALLDALMQLRSWIDDDVVGAATTMSVNVSARQLVEPSFCDVVKEALARAWVPAHLLWLEVTETMMIDNPDLARDTLERIRATGVRIALDDFGTGYSSLSLLQKFPIQRIKIDRSFVSGITESANDRSLVRTVIAMGGSLGLDIVGEGVETVAQLQMLRELGCDRVQGYLISRPVPADAMRSTITALEGVALQDAFADPPLDRPGSKKPLGRTDAA